MKHNIIKIKLGNNYIRKDSTSIYRDNKAEWIKQHPNAVKYYGDLRKDKNNYKVVYYLTGFEYYWSFGKQFSYPRVIERYVEI